MFDRPGEKLKRLAMFDFIGVIIGSIILAFVFGITETRYGSEFDFFEFLSILLGGCSAAYITALVFYAFGELVDSTELTADATYEILRILQNTNLHTNSSPNTSLPRPNTNHATVESSDFKPFNFNSNPSTTHPTSNSKAILPSDFKMKPLADGKPEDWVCIFCHTKNKPSAINCKRCSKLRAD